VLTGPSLIEETVMLIESASVAPSPSVDRTVSVSPPLKLALP